jgi:hypothetical protein
MVDFELDVGDDDTTITGVLIKCQCDRKYKTYVCPQRRHHTTLSYLVDEAMKKKWYDGADMEKPDVRDMAGEVRCVFYMVKAYHERSLTLCFQGGGTCVSRGTRVCLLGTQAS